MKPSDKLHRLIKNAPKSKLQEQSPLDIVNAEVGSLKKISSDPIDHYDALMTRRFLFESKIFKKAGEKSIQRTIKYSGAHEERARGLLKKKLDGKTPGMGKLFNILVEEYEKEISQKEHKLESLAIIINLLDEDLRKLLSAKSHARDKAYLEAVKRYQKGRNLFMRSFFESGLTKDDLADYLTPKQMEFVQTYVISSFDSFMEILNSWRESERYLENET